MSTAVACALASALSGLDAKDSIRNADVRPGALTVLVRPLGSSGNAPVAADERRFAVQVLGRVTVGTIDAPAAGLPWDACEVLVDRMRQRAERLDGRPLALVVAGEQESVLGVAITNVGAQRPYPDEQWGAIDLQLGFTWNPALSTPALVGAGSSGAQP